MDPLAELTTTEILTSQPIYMVWAMLAFVFGSIVGSFLNVCIYRLPMDISVNHPKRSFCFRCGSQIAWYDNIPIISYFILGGKDRKCGAPFSPRYMLVEVLTGVLFCLAYLAWNDPWPNDFTFMTIWYFGFISLLIIGSFTDLDHWINLEYLSRWGTVVAVVFAFISGFIDVDSLVGRGGPFPYVRLEGGDWVDMVSMILAGPADSTYDAVQLYWWEPGANAFIGMLFAPLIVVSVSKLWEFATGKEGMGFGDVEIFALIGATVGATNSIIVLVLASFVGSIGGITLIIYNKLSKSNSNSPLRLGKWAEDKSAGAITTQELADNDVSESQTSPEDEIAKAKEFAKSLDHKFIDLDEQSIKPETIEEFPVSLAIDELIMPIEKKKSKWVIAVSNPLRTSMINAVRKALGDTEIQFTIAAESQLLAFTEQHFGERYDAEASSRKMANQQQSETVQQRRASWQEYALAARDLPPEKRFNSLPFIPWIAIGSLILLLGYQYVLELLNYLFVFNYGV